MRHWWYPLTVNNLWVAFSTLSLLCLPFLTLVMVRARLFPDHLSPHWLLGGKKRLLRQPNGTVLNFTLIRQMPDACLPTTQGLSPGRVSSWLAWAGFCSYHWTNTSADGNGMTKVHERHNLVNYWDLCAKTIVWCKCIGTYFFFFN